MPADRDAPLQHYRRMRDELLAAIDGLSDELMREPSLDGWSVKATWRTWRAGMTSAPARSCASPPATTRPGACRANKTRPTTR